MASVLKYPIIPPTMPAFAGILGFTVMALNVGVALLPGTGGAQTAEYYKQRGPKGYPFVACAFPSPNVPVKIRTPLQDLTHIIAILRPTITDLAYSLGVSRQAIYDWQSGKRVATENAARLSSLAQAADIFAAERIKPSAYLMRRPISSGKNFFELVRTGSSAEEAAQKLIQILHREATQRDAIKLRLMNRRPVAISESYDVPMLDEIG